MRKIQQIVTIILFFAIQFIFFFPSKAQIDTIPGLELWLRADSGVILDNGQQVKQWHDSSPNHFVFTQNDSNARPYFQNSFLNNKPILSFDGINDFFDGGNILNLTLNGNTIFLLANMNSTNGSFIAKSLAGGVPARYAILSENNQFEFLYQDDAARLLSTPTNTDFTLWSLTIDNQNSNAKMYENSIEKGQTTINGNYDMTSNYNFLIGAYNNSTGTIPPLMFLNGSIAEIIMFNKTLNIQEKEIIENYLMDKYAPPVRLPDDTNLTSFCPFTIKPHGYFTTYQWNTGEIIDTIIVEHSGYYNVTATDIFGRQSRDSVFIKFPDAGFAQTTHICAGDSALITSALGNIVQYSWSDGNTHNYDYIKNENRYFVTITDNFSCSIVDSFFIDVDSLSLYPLFLNDTVHLCEGNLLHIDQNAFSITHYLWLPTHDTLLYTTVQQPGFYTASVTDIIGCSKKDSVWIDILGKAPVAQFNTSHTCLGENTSFTDLSYSQDTATLNYWQWIIDNTDIIDSQQAQYLFNSYGNHNVELQVGTNSGCYQQISENVTVFPLPVSNFSIVGFCQQQQTYFTQQSNIPFGNLTTFYWIFGDGYDSYQENPVHIYQNTGNYSTTLITESDEGCSDTISKQIDIKYAPQAGFDVSPSCNNNPTFFADTSITLNVFPIMQWHWSFGDNNYSTSQNPSHIYTSEGLYNTQLIINILDGCTDTVSKTITVSSKPNAGFTTDSACVGQIMSVTDQSAISNGTITNWTWYININYYSHEQNPIITPYQEGSLPVMLIVESNTHCSDTAYKIIHVHPKPIVLFNVQPVYGAVPLTVDFENLSELGTLYWNFGDGISSLLSNPIHIYQDTGLFQASLVLTNIYGCIDSVEKSIMVVPNIVDLAVQKVTITESNSLINVTARIANLGTIPIVNPMLTFYTNEQQRITEIVNETLFSSDILNYTFYGKISTQYEPSYVCVEGSLSQPLTEISLLNNVACTVMHSQDAFLNLYPNPAEENLNVLFQLIEAQEINVQLVNSIGKELFNQNVPATNGFNQLSIDVSGLSQGVYLIVIHTQNTTFVKMFMKE